MCFIYFLELEYVDVLIFSVRSPDRVVAKIGFLGIRIISRKRQVHSLVHLFAIFPFLNIFSIFKKSTKFWQKKRKKKKPCCTHLKPRFRVSDTSLISTPILVHFYSEGFILSPWSMKNEWNIILTKIAHVVLRQRVGFDYRILWFLSATNIYGTCQNMA